MGANFLKTLEPYTAAGAFSPRDLLFARFMTKLAGMESNKLVLTSLLGNRQICTGHICLNLAAASKKTCR